MTRADYLARLTERFDAFAATVRKLLSQRTGLQVTVEHANDIAAAILTPMRFAAILADAIDDETVWGIVDRARVDDPALFIVPSAARFNTLLTRKGMTLPDARAMFERLSPDARRRVAYHA
ncbi:MAG: hypothetical protein JNM89_02180 [Hyphomicrobiaceae bacterium]|nr:hypothetical protein [Hyphomicrobiaceae bacterium]